MRITILIVWEHFVPIHLLDVSLDDGKLARTFVTAERSTVTRTHPLGTVDI